MSDAPFYNSPAQGLVATPNFNPSGPQNGFANMSSGTMPQGAATSGVGDFTAVRKLDRAYLQLQGAGQYNVPIGRSPQLAIGQGSSSIIGGVRGAMQVNFIAPSVTTGSQGLAMLVGGGLPTPTQFLGLYLAGGSTAIAITDVNGATAYSATFGSTLVGPVEMILTWDSAIGSITLSVNGVATSGIVASAWTPFVPTAALYGSMAFTSGITTFVSFLGTFGRLQVAP